MKPIFFNLLSKGLCIYIFLVSISIRIIKRKAYDDNDGDGGSDTPFFLPPAAVRNEEG